MRTNWVGLIDEWATRFFHELDYEREAQNGMTFKEQMAGLEGIVVADVYQDLSNKEVLTTVWVEGKQSTINPTVLVQLVVEKQSRFRVESLRLGMHMQPSKHNAKSNPSVFVRAGSGIAIVFW